MVYQVLQEILNLLGYHGEMRIEKGDSGNGDDIKTFSLDSLMMREVLESRDPQVIRHLLIYAEDHP